MASRDSSTGSEGPRVDPRPLPVPTPTSSPFWEALEREAVVLQFCPTCDRYVFYPRSHCPGCLDEGLEWREVSGTGRLYTFSVTHQPTAPQFAAEVPQMLAVVELDVGPRLTTTIVGAAPEDLEIGRLVHPVFEHRDGGHTLLRYRLV